MFIGRRLVVKFLSQALISYVTDSSIIDSPKTLNGGKQKHLKKGKEKARLIDFL